MDKTGLPYALVMKKGSVADWKLRTKPEARPLPPAPARQGALDRIGDAGRRPARRCRRACGPATS